MSAETVSVRSPAASPPSARTMDIGMISYGLPTPGLKRGGIERIAHDLARGLAARNHRVTVYSWDAGPPDAAYRVERLRGRRFGTSWLGRRLTMGYLGNVLTADRRLRTHQVIVTHGDSLLLPALGRPVLRVMHGSALAEAISARSPWRIALQLGVYAQELLTGALQRHVVGVSDNTRRSNPFVRRVIPNGADLAAFYPDPGALSAEPSLLFVGALGGRKRGARLVEWFRDEIRPAWPTCTLTMLSEPGLEVAGVTYRSGLDGTALAKLYRSAWVYCSPSTYEGFGLPYLEAMASGTPVVATSNPGSREVLAGGAAGLLVADDAFAGTVIRLLGDKSARDRLAALGLARAQDFTLDRMIDAYESLLLDMTRP